MVNSKKTTIKDLMHKFDALPAIYVQVNAEYLPAKKQTRSVLSLDREKRKLAANLTTYTNEYRFFDDDWNEYPVNYEFPGEMPEGFSRWKWSKRVLKYVKNKIYS
jgi:hypothetical protein